MYKSIYIPNPNNIWGNYHTENFGKISLLVDNHCINFEKSLAKGNKHYKSRMKSHLEAAVSSLVYTKLKFTIFYILDTTK